MFALPPLPDFARNTLIRAHAVARAARFGGPDDVPAMGPARNAILPKRPKAPAGPESAPPRPDLP